MKRPVIEPSFSLICLAQYPEGTCDRAGLLVDTHANWRTVTPVVDPARCSGCLRCYLSCPEGVIFRLDRKIGIDLDFCKGCGVCAHECAAGAIRMSGELP